MLLSSASLILRSLSNPVAKRVFLFSKAADKALSPLVTARFDSSGVSSKWRRPYTIVVEGNMGAGKTTFLNKFAEGVSEEEMEVVAEPVDRWRNAQGHNLLDLMYSDPARWSFLFQTYVQLTLLQQHAKRTNKPIKIMERSLARFCFIENLYAHGKMSEVEYAVISEWFNFLVVEFDFSVDLIVYLRTGPEVAFDRVLRRSRQEENKVPLEYLRDLHELHEDWLVRKTKFQPLSAPVMVIDANEDLSTLASKYLDCRETIFKMAFPTSL